MVLVLDVASLVYLATLARRTGRQQKSQSFNCQTESPRWISISSQKAIQLSGSTDCLNLYSDFMSLTKALYWKTEGWRSIRWWQSSQCFLQRSYITLNIVVYIVITTFFCLCFFSGDFGFQSKEDWI